MLAQASEQHGLTLRLGFELEFYLLHKPQHNRAASGSGGSGGINGSSGGGGSSGGSGGSGGSSASVPARLPQPIDSSNYCSSSAFDAAAQGEVMSRQSVSKQRQSIKHFMWGRPAVWAVVLAVACVRKSDAWVVRLGGGLPFCPPSSQLDIPQMQHTYVCLPEGLPTPACLPCPSCLPVCHPCLSPLPACLPACLPLAAARSAGRHVRRAFLPGDRRGPAACRVRQARKPAGRLGGQAGKQGS